MIAIVTLLVSYLTGPDFYTNWNHLDIWWSTESNTSKLFIYLFFLNLFSYYAVIGNAVIITVYSVTFTDPNTYDVCIAYVRLNPVKESPLDPYEEKLQIELFQSAFYPEFLRQYFKLPENKNFDNIDIDEKKLLNKS